MPWIKIGNGRVYKYGFPEYWGGHWSPKSHVVTGGGSISLCGHVGNYLYVAPLEETPADACKNCIRLLGEPNCEMGL